MEPHAVQSNTIVCNIPNEVIKSTINAESIVADERKNNNEFSSYDDEMRTISVSVIQEEFRPEVLRFSLSGAQNECLKKKLLVLDVNGLLVDICFPSNDRKADVILAPDVAMFKRPFCLEFLKFCFENFEVALWSSRLKKHLEEVIDPLMGDMKSKLLFCWDVSHCTKGSFTTLENKQKWVWLKDLRKIWEKHDPSLPWEKGYYNESNTLLLDDSPQKALLNPPHTSVFPLTFSHQNKGDNSLAVGGDLREYLDGLAKAENMRKYVEEHSFGQDPINETSEHWNLYQQVIGNLSASQSAE